MERRSHLGIIGGHRSGQGWQDGAGAWAACTRQGARICRWEGGGAVCILELLDSGARPATSLSASAEQGG